MKAQLRQLIRDGRTERALKFLLDNVRDEEFKTQVDIIASRFENLQRKIRLNEIEAGAASIENNRINAAILEVFEKSDAPRSRVRRQIMYALMVIAGFIGLFWAYRQWSDTFSITVYIIGEKGPHDKPLKGAGKVVLHTDYDHIEDINAKGEATFNGLPVRFRSSPVQLNLVKELNVTYEAFNPDSMYVIGNAKSLHLMVRLSGLERIKGVVRSEQNLPVPWVKISMAKGVTTVTDEDGRFELDIPKNLQKEEVTLTAFKEGFALLDFNVYPQTGAEAKVILKRK